jgi:hypothetical protein
MKSSSSSSSSTKATFSSAGRELLLELKRNQGRQRQSGACGTGNSTAGGHGYLPAYNTKLVRQCFHDLMGSVQALQEEVQAVAMMDNNNHTTNTNNPTKENKDNADASSKAEPSKPNMSSRPSILFHNASIQRHKRCLLAYHKHRLDYLKDSSSHSSAAAAAAIHSDADGNGSTTTTTGSSSNAAEVEFQRDYAQLRDNYAAAMAIDLNVLPPTSHMVQVRVLQHLGDVVVESGRSLTMTKGSWLYVARSDVLEFLQDGSMELMDGEEVDF